MKINNKKDDQLVATSYLNPPKISQEVVGNFMKGIEEDADIIDWYYFSQSIIFPHLPFEFVWRFREEWNWSAIANNFSFDLNNEFLEKFVDYIDWDKTMEYRQIKEEFIRKHIDKMSWLSISCDQSLSDQFLIDFKDKIQWYAMITFNHYINDDHIKELYGKLFNGKTLDHVW